MRYIIVLSIFAKHYLTFNVNANKYVLMFFECFGIFWKFRPTENPCLLNIILLWLQKFSREIRFLKIGPAIHTESQCVRWQRTNGTEEKFINGACRCELIYLWRYYELCIHKHSQICSLSIDGNYNKGRVELIFSGITYNR